MERSAILTAATAGLWLLLAGPAFLLAAGDGLEGLTYAALLCLLPGWLVFFLASRYVVANFQAQLILLGTVLRMLFVLVGVFCVQSVRAQLQFREFLVWIIVFYLAMLLVETLLLLKQPSP